MKRASALMLALTLMLSLCACTPALPGRSPGAKTAEAVALSAPVLMEAFDPETLIGDAGPYANQYEAYIGMLEGLYRQGQYFEAYGLYRPAAFVYGAGSSASGAMRLCMECVLFLKGEGESLDDVSMGRYADWSSLARISPASPYPDYFEGLVYQMQGNAEKAAEYFTRAITFPSWPEEGWDFTYLKMLSTDELYMLRDYLLELESAFHKASVPELIPIERDLYNFSADYLIARAGEAITAGESATAYGYAAAAVCADPFNGSAYAAAAVASAALGNSDEAARYISDGLYVDPPHEGLNTLLRAFEAEGK